MTIQDICASFDIGGRYVRCKELSTGIINCTYHVEYFRDGMRKDYIVQRINTEVFKEPKKLMSNIIKVTDYVRQNVIKKGPSTKRFVLRAFLTKKDRKPFLIDEAGGYWRCYRYAQSHRKSRPVMERRICDLVAAERSIFSGDRSVTEFTAP